MGTLIVILYFSTEMRKLVDLATILSFFLLKRDESLSPIEIIGGLYCGIFLFAGYAFQNYGLILTSPSRSAFITSGSVILVPLIKVELVKRIV